MQMTKLKTLNMTVIEDENENSEDDNSNSSNDSDLEQVSEGDEHEADE